MSVPKPGEVTYLGTKLINSRANIVAAVWTRGHTGDWMVVFQVEEQRGDCGLVVTPTRRSPDVPVFWQSL